MTTPQLRILGLTLERVADFRSQPSAKSAGLYAALDRRFQVVDIVCPALPKPEYYLNRLMMMQSIAATWRGPGLCYQLQYCRSDLYAKHVNHNRLTDTD